MKDPNCPDCGGRSFSAYDPSDYYFVCKLCEEPDEKYIAWYRSKWPAQYDAWKARSNDE